MNAAFDLLCALVLETDARWGDVADQLQREDALAVASLNGPRRHWLGRTRGYSKTTDVGGLAAALMLTQAPHGARLYAGAADRDQARLLLDALEGFTHRTPEIAGAIRIEASKAHTATSVLEVLPADAASSFGLKPWVLLIDELCQHDDTPRARRFYEALTTALPKVADSRLVILTTAGDPAHFSRAIYENALAERELWRVSESHDPPAWIDPTLIEAERRRLPVSSFARLWRNEWAQSEDAAFPDDDVRACVAHDGPLEPVAATSYVICVDLGWRHDRTVIGVGHRELGEEGRVVADRMEVYAARGGEVDLTAIEERIYELSRRYNAAPVWVDPAQAIALMQRLTARGVWTREHTFSQASNTRLALRLLELVRSRRLALPDDDALVEELLSVRIVERGPGLFKLDSAQGGHDDQAVVVGMLAVHLDQIDTGPATTNADALGDVRVPEVPVSGGARAAITSLYGFRAGSVQERIGGRP